MPPINELTRIEPVHLERLEHQGTSRPACSWRLGDADPPPDLADQVAADTNDVLMWRDEALMLNLASFGPDEHQLIIQAGIEGLRDILDLDARRVPGRASAARPIELDVDPPTDLTIEGWWDQARTLEDE